MDINKPHIYRRKIVATGKFYIGKHKGGDKYYIGSGTEFKKDLKLYKEFTTEILEYVENILELNEREIFWLQHVDAANNPLYYNKTNKSYGPISQTKEWKKIQSERAKGNKYHTGIKHSQETKDKISNSNKGKSKTLGKTWIKSKVTQETKDKISESLKGRDISKWKHKIYTEERNRKISESHKKRYKKDMKNEKYVVLSLSGGMDSSTLLLHLLEKGFNVCCLSFDYGQKHKIELKRAKELVEYINNQRFQSDFPRPYNEVKHQIIKLDGLSSLLNSSLVEGGSEVPEGHYEQDNMKDTVVPNRNKIFSSIIQAVALSIATKNNTECIIAMGIHAGDHFIYPDCRQEFRDRDDQAFVEGNWNAHLVKTYTPYLKVNKLDILQDGANCCVELGLNFNEVYKRTNTSYKPIRLLFGNGEDREYRWYSDYKSASSVERIEAFIKLGIADPLAYADEETGPVSWEVAKSHVEQILKEFSK